MSISRYNSLQTILPQFRTLTKAAFARYGFATADLLSHWTEIAGPDLAKLATPERIRWPRGAEADAKAARSGGTLFVKAAPGFGLDMQYRGAELIERINGFFGYGVIATLKITEHREASLQRLQKPVRAALEPLPETLAMRIAPIEDEALRHALERWAQTVQALRRSPQGK